MRKSIQENLRDRPLFKLSSLLASTKTMPWDVPVLKEGLGFVFVKSLLVTACEQYGQSFKRRQQASFGGYFAISQN